MPGTLTPGQMFDHELNPVKGWPSPYALDKSGQIAAAQGTIDRGMCCSLDTAGKWIKGCANGNMPLFAFPGSGDFDVASDVGNISGGNIAGLVATGGYELETTEFVGTPGPTTALTSPVLPDADAGKLKAASGGMAGNDMVVGVVSDKAPYKNDHGKMFLRFWPVYAPKR